MPQIYVVSTVDPSNCYRFDSSKQTNLTVANEQINLYILIFNWYNTLNLLNVSSVFFCVLTFVQPTIRRIYCIYYLKYLLLVSIYFCLVVYYHSLDGYILVRTCRFMWAKCKFYVLPKCVCICVYIKSYTNVIRVL